MHDSYLHFSKGHKDIGVLAKYKALNLRLVEPRGKVLPGTVGKEVILIPRSFREFCLRMKYWKLTVCQVNKTICVRLDSKSYFSKIKTNHNFFLFCPVLYLNNRNLKLLVKSSSNLKDEQGEKRAMSKKERKSVNILSCSWLQTDILLRKKRTIRNILKSLTFSLKMNCAFILTIEGYQLKIQNDYFQIDKTTTTVRDFNILLSAFTIQ